jgi:hypothetical protein
MGEILHDRDIREPLFEWLETQYGIVRFLEEKNMGRSRADILMVTYDALYGIEIKSDADTYERLQRQVRDYNKYYDFNMVVTGVSHASHIEEHVPSWWGVVIVEKLPAGYDFYMHRSCGHNPKLKLEKKISLLWRPEMAAIQEAYHLPKYKEKSKRFVEQKLVEKLDPSLLNKAISDALFERDYTLIEEEIEEYRRQGTH